MPIIAAKCPNCNGDIQLDDTKRSGFCMYCGSQVLVQDAIQFMSGLPSADRLVQNGEKFLELGQYEKALTTYERITNDYPEDYRGWWGVVRARTQNFRIPYNEDAGIDAAYSAALKLAPEDKKASLRTRYEAWRAVFEVRRANEMIECYMSLIRFDISKVSALRGSLPPREKKWASVPKRMVGVIAGCVIALLIFIIIVAPSPIWRQLIGPVCFGVAVGLIVIGYMGRKQYLAEKGALERDKKQLSDAEGNLAYNQQRLMEYRQRLTEAQRRMAQR